MPAVSKAQARLFQKVLAYLNGAPGFYPPEVRELGDSMDIEDVQDLSTMPEHQFIPDHVPESMDHLMTFEDYSKKHQAKIPKVKTPKKKKPKPVGKIDKPKGGKQIVKINTKPR
jgi:hypothetical protein